MPPAGRRQPVTIEYSTPCGFPAASVTPRKFNLSMIKQFLSYRYLWWIGHGLLVAVACFFIVFGIQLLIASYSLNNPFSFILTFFAACLMILISATLAVGFIFRMRAVYVALKCDDV